MTVLVGWEKRPSRQMILDLNFVSEVLDIEPSDLCYTDYGECYRFLSYYLSTAKEKQREIETNEDMNSWNY